jgi:hypothetical protein
LNTHGFLVGGENGVTFAGEAASLGTVDTISAREVASFAGSGIFFSVHTWFTDSTLGCVLTDSAFGISTSFTLGGCSIPEGSWGAHRAFASFLAEETSSWASFTVTIVANVMFGVTDDTVVGKGWINTLLVNDLSRLTVGHVDINISVDLLASQSVLGKAPCLLTGETLGLGTDGAIGSHVSADFAGHSLGESSGSGRDHRFTSITFVTSSVLIAFTTSGAANGGMGADFAHCGTRCRCRVFKMGGFASFAYVSWAEATVCRSTSSALNTFWSVTCGGSDLEVFTSRTLEASVHTQDVIDLTLHATSNTSTLCISSSCTTGKGDSLGIGIDELLETCFNLRTFSEAWAGTDITSSSAITTLGTALSELSSNTGVYDDSSSCKMASLSGGSAASSAIFTCSIGFTILISLTFGIGRTGVGTSISGGCVSNLYNVGCRNGCKQNRFFHG